MSTNQELFAALPGTVLPISDHELLFLPQGMDDRHVMTAEVHQAFADCAVFATLDEHIDALNQQFPQAGRQNIERVVQSLVSRGLLQSASDFKSKFGQHAGNSKALQTMTVTSAGHPAALESFLASVPDTEKRDQTLALMDISDAADQRARKAELVAEFGRRTGKRVVLLDQKRERILTEQSAQHPELSSAFERLIGKTAGPRARALNSIALLHRHERVLALDDHQRMRTYGQHRFQMHLAWPQVRDAWVFDSVDAALKSTPRGPSLWEVAGTVGSTIGSLSEHLPLAGRQIDELSSYFNGRISRMVCGVIGSADTNHSLFVFALPPERHRLLDTAAKMSQACSGEAVHLRYLEGGIAATGGKPACAYDFSGAVGFALGDGESADRSLAAASLFVDPTATELCLPISIERRAPSAPREQNNRLPIRLDSARFVADQLVGLQRACFASNAAGRWRWLAGQFRDMADASQATRETLLWHYMSTKRAELLSELQHYHINATEAPDAWRHELLATIQSQAEILMQARGYHLDDFNRFEPAAEQFSNYLRELADTALAWDLLWNQTN
jgi:hypothetical protein